MPVEIEEMVVRIVVDSEAGAGGGRGGRGARDPGQVRDDLVDQVVEQVLDILRQKEER